MVPWALAHIKLVYPVITYNLDDAENTTMTTEFEINKDYVFPHNLPAHAVTYGTVNSLHFPTAMMMQFTRI